MDKATSGGSASRPAGGRPPALTLRTEHDLLRREVTARAEGVLQTQLPAGGRNNSCEGFWTTSTSRC